MNRMGWLLIGFAVLLLLTRGGFGFFFVPIFPALLLGMLLFGIFGGWRRAYRYGWAGPRGYGRGGCYEHSPPDKGGEPQPKPEAGEHSYTGETTRL
jgi:hypothetical protein